MKQWPTGYGQPFRRGEVILLEVHYDNPDGSLAVGLVDKSGIDFVYQLEEPEHGAVTTISMGDVLVNEDETIGEGVSSYTYRCDGTCFRDEQPAKIWYVGLHGHLAAEFIQLRQFRDKVEINRWEEEVSSSNEIQTGLNFVSILTKCPRRSSTTSTSRARWRPRLE